MIGPLKLSFFNSLFLLLLISSHLLAIFIMQQLEVYSFVVFAVLAIFTFLISKKIDFEKDFASIIFFSYVNLSFISYPIFSKLLTNQTPHFSSINVGASILCFSFLLWLLIPLKERNIKKNTPLFIKNVKLFDYTNLFYAMVAFLLSFICYKLNITKMGVPHPELPYKLEPLLNILRNMGVPILSIVIIDMYFSSKFAKKAILSLLVFFAWLIYESYIRGSRGVILFASFPLLFLVVKYNISKKKMLIFFIVSGLLAPFIYLSGNVLRNAYVSKKSITLESFKNVQLRSTTFWHIYQRIFYDNIMFQKFDPYVKKAFFINNLDLYRKYDGGVQFHTHVLDGHKKGAAHSSGITALSDGYLLGGYFLMYLTAGVFLLLFLLSDRKLLGLFSYSNGLQANFIFFIFQMLILADGFWSFFLFRSPFTVILPFIFFAFSFYYFKFFATKSFDTQSDISL